MRYVIEDTQAFRILAERARAREVAHAAALAAGTLQQAPRRAARKAGRVSVLLMLAAVVLVARALVPAELRLALAAGVALLGSLALAGFMLGQLSAHPRHSHPSRQDRAKAHG